MKNVIITFDTEGHVGFDPISHLIWGNTSSGKQLGIPLLMDMCDEVSAKALFFVDMAEAWDYGEERIAEVLKYIVARGHDVGVHIHPDHMADAKRLFLFEYSYDEQFSIIKQCTDLYEKILGKKPLAFRAGKYGANRDTLRILSELGYKADFSEYYGYDKWCGIKPPVTGDMSVKLKSGLLEIPTISYENHFGSLFRRYDKYDIDMPLQEQNYVLNVVRTAEYINNIVLFGHSFSLIQWRSTPDAPRENAKGVRRFRKVLNRINKCDDLRFIDLEEAISGDYPLIPSFETPHISGIRALYFFIIKGFMVIKSRIDIASRRKKMVSKGN